MTPHSSGTTVYIVFLINAELLVVAVLLLKILHHAYLIPNQPLGQHGKGLVMRYRMKAIKSKSPITGARIINRILFRLSESVAACIATFAKIFAVNGSTAKKSPP